MTVPTLILEFPARRYHATPWGHHVNEGLIEWPPSPWRVLRALLSTGYTRLGWPSAGPPEDARTLVLKLAKVLPSYSLPLASAAHTRHFMPMTVLDKGREKTSLVFDTWAQIDSGRLAIHWAVELEPQEIQLLDAITQHLGYLGRSESWVTGELKTSVPRLEFNAFPCGSRPDPGVGWEQIALLAATPPAEYAEWRESAVVEALVQAGVDLTRKKRTKAERNKIESINVGYPSDLLDCLQVHTSWLQQQGWSQPPGSRRILYWRPSNALDLVPTQRARRPAAERVEAALLSIATESGNDYALPPLRRTLPQAELLHRALISRAASNGPPPVVLTGCDEAGRPLQSSHKHAHILPLDLDGDGHLEHFLIWAPMGLGADARAAIRMLRQTFMKGGLSPLRVGVAGFGSLSDLWLLPSPFGAAIRALTRRSTAWRSATPFVPPRYVKKRGSNTIEGQIISECEVRSLPRPEAVEILDVRSDPSVLKQRQFVRVRRRGPSPPSDCGFSVRLRFSDPVAGPIALGYASHFGLGVFVGDSQ